MDLLLTTAWFLEHYGDEVRRRLDDLACAAEPIHVGEPGCKLAPETLDRIRLAFFHGDFRTDPEHTRRFFGAALRAPNLSWMHLPNSGVDDPVFARLLAHGVRLSTSPEAAAEPIAQTAIAGILALARGLPFWMAAQRERRWRPHPVAPAPADLRGQTMVLVGVGAIGSHVARLAAALGLRVLGVRRDPSVAVDHVGRMHAVADLDIVLPEADWLVLACPLTDATRGLLDASRLALLRSSAHVVNVARGEVVDEAALTVALTEGRLAGAYLDVFAEEPLPPSSPLWSLPNVLISPHDAAASAGAPHRASRLFLDNLARWRAGAALRNEVQPA